MNQPFATLHSRQSGMSLLAAIFVLLLLSGLAAGILHFSSTSQVNSSQDFEGSRAYQVARAGVEWGLFQLDPNDASSTLPFCFGTTTLSSIPGYSVEVRCTHYPAPSPGYYQEGPRQIRMFQIVAKARSIAAFPTNTEREIAVTVEKCRDPAFAAAPFGC